ncbi:MAG: hypothetical protein HOQ46_13655 [Saccharothrix sp.]|nr:hypothetical protein [Saccharothrix sp.]
MHDTSTALHTAIARQLRQDIAARLVDPLDVLLDPETGATAALRRQLEADVEMWAAQVIGPDERLAAATASRLVSAVYRDGDRFDPPARWWRTPFGNLVARRFGHPGAEVVGLTAASAMLGITRQGAHDLVKRGKLHRDPSGAGILVSSVRDRLNSAGAVTSDGR